MNIEKPNLQKTYNSGILQGQSYRILQNHLTLALEPFKISIPEWKIIGLLYDHNELKVADLANILAVDPPLITRLIHSLLRKGFVKKISIKNDKRISMILPTEKTMATIPDIELNVRSQIRKLLEGITAEEMTIYIKVLMTIVKNGQLIDIKKNYLIT